MKCVFFYVDLFSKQVDGFQRVTRNVRVQRQDDGDVTTTTIITRTIVVATDTDEEVSTQ